MQQSLSFIDYIYLNKSKIYAGHMQAKLKQRKIILENFAALIVFFPQAKRDNPSKSASNQRLKLKCSVAFAACAHNFKKHSDKSIAQATVFQSLTVAVSSKGLVLLSLLKRKDYFGLKCILSYYVPVQTIVSPYDANCVTPLIYPTTDLDFLFGIIVSFDLSFYFLFF